MNNNDMTGLLNLAYEIEGLLLLHINRGDEAAPEMKRLLVEKATRLLEGLEKDSDEKDSAGPVAVAAPVVVPAPEPVQVSEPQAGPAPARSAEEVADDKAIAASVLVEETEDAGETVAQETTAAVEAPAVQDAPAVKEESAPAPATINDSMGAESQLTLDERLARERAADISKAFTLNDRFRFRRELFRNSDEEFKETLDVIGSMSSMEEAEDYFFNDLCWDPAKEEVKEFMAVVVKHF